jgi:hypothetical protein
MEKWKKKILQERDNKALSATHDIPNWGQQVAMSREG